MNNESEQHCASEIGAILTERENERASRLAETLGTDRSIHFQLLKLNARLRAVHHAIDLHERGHDAPLGPDMWRLCDDETSVACDLLAGIVERISPHEEDDPLASLPSEYGGPDPKPVVPECDDCGHTLMLRSWSPDNPSSCAWCGKRQG